MRKKTQFFLTMEFYLINVEGLMETEDHHLPLH